ncbi:MAG: hypothetical protein JWN85_4839 [Gammaproteobacteria bacterium]|nr:hypothetical protein [Gammaproteobacteria bacterium]
MNSGRVLATAGILLAVATVFGAFGAHALRAHLTPDRLQVYETAVRYHFFHALGLLGIGLALRSIDSGPLRWAAMLVVIGIVLFSGSLYGLTFGAPRALGIVTPFGGLALIAGWICFAAGVWRH